MSFILILSVSAFLFYYSWQETKFEPFDKAFWEMVKKEVQDEPNEHIKEV